MPEGGQAHHQPGHQHVLGRGSDTNAVLGLVEEFNGGHAGRVNAVGGALKRDDHDHKSKGRHCKSNGAHPPSFERGSVAQRSAGQKRPQDAATKGQHGCENVRVDVLIHVKVADKNGIQGSHETDQGGDEPEPGTFGIQRVVEVPGVGHLSQSTEGETCGKHHPVDAGVVGFRNEKGDISRSSKTVKEHGDHDGERWQAVTGAGGQQTLVVRQR